MASVIKIKRSAVSGTPPTTSKLDTAELAINTADGIMYSANSTVVFEIGSTLSSLSVNSQSFPSTSPASDGLVMKAYANGQMYWEADNSTGVGTINTFTRFEFTATSGQTNFAGNDNDSQSLNYTANSGVTIFLNGILLENTTDYTATNSANVVLTNAADVDDVLEVFAYHVGSANSITISANNNVGIGNTSPADDLSVQGTLFVSGNVSINSTLKDSSGRALAVYYANGDIAWGN
jgi:hypothetical protein